MTQILRQSTAVDILIGPFVDLTDGYTSETGESPTVKLSKNGQTLVAKNDVTTPVSDADGYYNCELDATDTNTVGTLVITVAASFTALPVRHECMVVEELVYDRIYASNATAGDTGSISAAVWNATTRGVTAIGANAVDTGSFTGTAALANDTGAFVTSVWSATTRSVTALGANAVDTGSFTGTAAFANDTGVFVNSMWAATTRTITSAHDTGVLLVLSQNDTGSRSILNKLTFDTGGNELHADIRKVVNVQIKGTGDTGLDDTWRPVTEA